MIPENQLSEQSAVLAVDVQNDFCPGGALAVDHGDRVVPVLNEWISAARNNGAVVAASRDWHPPNHMSFSEEGGQWPKHCVQNTEGAEFHPDLDLSDSDLIISNAQDPNQEQYSAFDDPELADWLVGRGVDTVWIGGLALDVCVRASALDAVEAGFDAHLIPGASYPIDEESGRNAIEEMREAGVMVSQ